MSTEKFIEERKYLKGVSEKTLAWYKDSFRAFEGALDTEEQVKRRIVKLRQRGLKPVSVNTYILRVKRRFGNRPQKYTVRWYDGGDFHTSSAFEHELTALPNN